MMMIMIMVCMSETFQDYSSIQKFCIRQIMKASLINLGDNCIQNFNLGRLSSDIWSEI